MIPRQLTSSLAEATPAISGDCLAGLASGRKTTLAKESDLGKPSHYLDLERPSDLPKLADLGALFFRLHGSTRHPSRRTVPPIGDRHRLRLAGHSLRSFPNGMPCIHLHKDASAAILEEIGLCAFQINLRCLKHSQCFLHKSLHVYMCLYLVLCINGYKSLYLDERNL